MASTFETETFKHERLPDASTYIRLVEIISADPARNITVHCRLTTWLMTSAPVYTAISYTWGDPRLTKAILVNGKKMTVRGNCEDVLRQARHNKDGYFWIDAICINQADNHEKSFQVAKMGEVYRNARQTLACVGRHADGSQFLLGTLREVRQGYIALGGDLSDTHSLEDFLLQTLSDSFTLYVPQNALSAFFRRNYFKRVWIYQELFLGNDVLVCCGDDTVDFLLLRALHGTIYTWLVERPKGVYRFTTAQHKDLFPPSPTIRLLLEVVAVGKKSVGLSTMISAVGGLQCEDPRDRVFGTLAIIDWGEKTPIRPDYRKDPFDLAIEVLQQLHRPSCDILVSVLEDIIKIAHLVGIPHNPSRRLADEIHARQWRKPMATRKGAESVGQTAELKPTIFMAYRICSHDERWYAFLGSSSCLVDKGSALRQGKPANLPMHNHSPTIQKWSKGTVWDVKKTPVLLPEEARPQDWLLIPYFDRSAQCQLPIALIARDHHDGRSRLVGKALFAWQRDWPSKEFQHEVPNYGVQVYLDYEDLAVLAHSCNWSAVEYPFSSNANEPHKLQVDDYFQMAFCGEKSLSYSLTMQA